jgi:uncharacterized protein YjbI with pentapeptide repeats
MKILNRFTNSVIIEDDTKRIRELIIYCIENNISLRGADFGGYNLMRFDFKGADLELASFRYCELENASFEGANIKKADFTGANLCKKVLNYIIVFGG